MQAEKKQFRSESLRFQKETERNVKEKVKKSKGTEEKKEKVKDSVLKLFSFFLKKRKCCCVFLGMNNGFKFENNPHGLHKRIHAMDRITGSRS